MENYEKLYNDLLQNFNKLEKEKNDFSDKIGEYEKSIIEKDLSITKLKDENKLLIDKNEITEKETDNDEFQSVFDELRKNIL